MARWNSCNILQVAPDANRLWRFAAKGRDFVLDREQKIPGGEPLPSRLVAKSWSSLWQPKLNVAWLPPESVFLRVIELPKSPFEETLAMVELQLEKLSPLPVAQIVWTLHVLPGAPVSDPARSGIAKHAGPETSAPVTTGDLQHVVVVIAGRAAVEEFLGKLEKDGYLADRLEAPMLDQLEAAPATADGAWIYAGARGKDAALVAWRSNGVLRNLCLIVLPPEGDRAKSLKDQLAQLCWAGEMEGWLTGSPQWHLVADPVNAAEWEKLLREALDEPVRVVEPPPPAELAARTARRAAASAPGAALLPAEFSARYHQQFVDRLWLRGLVTTGILYAIGVVIYFCATHCFRIQDRRSGAAGGAIGRQLHQRAAAQGALRGAHRTAAVEIRGAGLLEDCRRATARRPHAATLQFRRRPETHPERRLLGGPDQRDFGAGQILRRGPQGEAGRPGHV